MRAPGEFVGRGEVLSTIREHWHKARSGQGSVLLVTAPAGGGKTALVHHVAKVSASEAAHTWLEATAYAPLSGIAYAPVVDALGRLFRQESKEQVKKWLHGLPELAQLFPQFAPPGPASPGGSEIEGMRLLNNFAELVERVAALCPVLFFFDDLHWADSATLSLFHYLAQGIEDTDVMLVGALREEELEASPTLRKSLRSLKRMNHIAQFSLSSLSHEETTRLFISRVGGPPNPDLRARLVEKTGGSPLFLHTVIDALQTRQHIFFDGHSWCLASLDLPLPDSVIDLVQERLEQLDPAPRSLLGWLALSPNGVTHPLLCALTAKPEEWIEAQIEALCASGLIVERPHEGEILYQWKHPLLQEAAYAELPLAVRRRLHRRFAEELPLTASNLFQLANHYCGMGAEELTLEAFLLVSEAGTQAKQLGAHTEAARFLQAATTSARTLGKQDLLPKLLEGMGELQQTQGDLNEAQLSLHEANLMYQQQENQVGIARTNRQLSHVCWGLLQFDQAQHHIHLGLEALKGQDAQQEWEQLQSDRLMYSDRQYAFAQVQTILSQLAQQNRSYSPHFRISMGISELGALMRKGHHTHAEQQVEVLLHLAHQTKDWQRLIRVQNFAGLIASAQGDHLKAEEFVAANLSLLKRYDMLLFEPSVLAMGVICAYVSGAWTVAKQRATRGFFLSERMGLTRYAARHNSLNAYILAHQGNFEKARAYISEAKEIYGEKIGDIHASASFWLAESTEACESKNFALAAKILRQLPQNENQLHVDTTGISLFLQTWGRVFIAEQDVVSLGVLIKQFRQCQSTTPYCTAWADYFEAARAKILGQPEEAIRLWAQAIQTFEALALPFDLARAELAWLKETLSCHPRPDTWHDVQRRCLRRFQQLGAVAYEEEIKALAVMEQPPKVPQDHVHLSPREQEVIRCVVAGLSNKEIAQELHISYHTVGTHLKRIYKRLQIHSRMELSRIARENKLLEE